MKYKEITKAKSEEESFPLAAWFLGPNAENAGMWKEILDYIFNDYIHWRRNYFPTDPVILSREKRRSFEHWFDTLSNDLDSVIYRLKADYPTHSPRYIGHMKSELTLPSIIGYIIGMLYNPNNVSTEGAPVTIPFEIEAGKMVAEMLGFNPDESFTHITSGGTLANVEAFWVARAVQFAPLIVQEFCQEYNVDFKIKLPGQSLNKNVSIIDMKAKQLLNLETSEAIYIYRKLAQFLLKEKFGTNELIIAKVNKFIENSKFNIAKNGLYNVLNKLTLKPKIFVSVTAHYSIPKLTNILGYGENAIEWIPVLPNFRMDTEALKLALDQLKDDEYIAGVIGILGTTEEGAIDEIDKIVLIRQEYEKNKNLSFWLHIDGAWGGYNRALFQHPEILKHQKTQPLNLEKLAQISLQSLKVNDTFNFSIQNNIIESDIKIEWTDLSNYRAILSTHQADSITIDPHKMGYIPYPAGMISFKNMLVTEHVYVKAQIITDDKPGIKNHKQILPLNEFGSFIIEGSKPGAAAAACWLSHKTIPLNSFGHGKLIRSSLINTQKLYKIFLIHRQTFFSVDKHLHGEKNKPIQPFCFCPLNVPDSQLVCFIAKPMKVKNKKLVDCSLKLKELNELNKHIFQHLSISASKNPSSLEFFASRTIFNSEQYSFQNLKHILEQHSISEEEYNEEGLFVIRSTVMNPWYSEEIENGFDYLTEYLICLHNITRKLLN
ncbi:MAG: pyridoxal-dependent decarboxylase [Sediminibacterium sp.]|nr:pyridoxal-dependent decarboxylase [Sediminibacterium sp.]